MGSIEKGMTFLLQQQYKTSTQSQTRASTQLRVAILLHRTRFRRILCYCSWHHYMPKLAKQMVMIRRHKHKLELEDCLSAHISSRLKPHVAFRLVGQKTTDLTQEGPTCVRTFLNIRQDEVAGKKKVTNECPQSQSFLVFKPKSCNQSHTEVALVASDIEVLQAIASNAGPQQTSWAKHPVQWRLRTELHMCEKVLIDRSRPIFRPSI